MPSARPASPRNAVPSSLTPDRYAERVPHSPAPVDTSRPGRGALVTWRLLTLAYLGALAWLVLTPAAVAGQATGVVTLFARALHSLGIPFAVGYPVLEFTANIALFVPFGALAVVALPVRTPSRASMFAVIGAGGLSSIAIELIQLIVPGRVSALSDVIANTLGTAVGFALMWWMLRLSRRRRRAGASASDLRAAPATPRSGSQPPSA